MTRDSFFGTKQLVRKNFAENLSKGDQKRDCPVSMVFGEALSPPREGNSVDDESEEGRGNSLFKEG